MHTLFRGALAVVLAVALSACASLVTGGPLLRPGEPTGIIQVVNGSSRVVDAVLISDCSASTYGLNRLPSGTAIGPGQSYNFTVSAGCWDVDAGAVGYGEARQRMQVQAGGGVRYTVR
jgi:hypothetical protein